jgi:hypothetical protein
MVSREAAPGKGARSPSTSHVLVEPSRGVRHDMTHAGDRSQAEKRQGEALAIHVRRGFWKLKIMSVPGVELVGKQHHRMALTGKLLRRQATFPGGRSTLVRQGG